MNLNHEIRSEKKASTAESLLSAVTEQVSADLSQVLSSSSQVKNRIRILSEKMQIDKKTLARLVVKKSKPNYITVFKVYRFLLNEVNDALVVEKAPTVVREYLKKANPVTLEKKASYSAQIDEELKSNPLFSEIYILCSTGPVSKKDMQKRFGLYGMQLVERMLKTGLLAFNKKSEFIVGLRQATLTPEALLSMGLNLTQRYAKPGMSYELDHNLVAFYAEGLSEETYLQWIKIDQEAFRKKMALADQATSKGSKRAFTFNVTDTLESPEIDL